MTSNPTDEGLEQRSQRLSGSKNQEASTNTLGFAGRLFKACFELFSSLARAQAMDKVAEAEKHGICGELERFFLWGEGFNAEGGGLDHILESSAELRINVLSFLFEFGKVVAQGMIAHFGP